MLAPKRPPLKPVSIELHIDGGYICRGTTNFDIPSGSEVELFLVDAPESHGKGDWFFNFDEVLNCKVNINGKSAKLKALTPGTSIISFEKLGMKVTINVVGKEAVGFVVNEISEEIDE